MSILAAAVADAVAAAADAAAAAPAVPAVPAGAAPEAVTAIQVAFAVGLVAFGTAIAYVLGAFRRNSVVGPPRLATETSVARVLVVLVIGFVAWFGMQIVYGAIRAAQHRMSGSPEPFGAHLLGPADYALLATLPFIVGVLVLGFGDRVAKSTLPRELGWAGGVLPRGIGVGLLAMLSVLPIMFGAMIVLEWLYQLVGYEHPTEHELLTVLGRSRDPVTKGLIIGGATLLAPVCEEFLFRGHLQTILVYAFAPRPSKGFPVLQQPPVAPVMASDGPVAAPVAPPMMVPLPPPPLESEALHNPSPGARWAAIALASLLFSVLHPGWTWPLIFLLSLGLGYAYERTGNLWVPVTMHLVFNTVNTVVFLAARSLL